MNFDNPIIVGVASGILTAATIYFLTSVFKNVIIPWYLKLIYRGVDISGSWRSEENYSNGKTTGSLILNQNAHNLHGTCTFHQDIAGEINISTSEVTGEVWEGCVTLKLRSIDRKRLSFGTMLLKVEGNALRGYGLHRIVIECKDSPLKYGDILNEQLEFNRDKT